MLHMPISLAQIESDWTLRDDASSLIGNISCTKQSNVLRVKNCLSSSFATVVLQCLTITDGLFCQDVPPYNGFGSLEDSLQSCLSLVPQPPKKDFIKMLENDHKVLRYAATMVSYNHPNRLWISYCVTVCKLQ